MSNVPPAPFGSLAEFDEWLDVTFSASPLPPQPGLTACTARFSGQLRTTLEVEATVKAWFYVETQRAAEHAAEILGWFEYGLMLFKGTETSIRRPSIRALRRDSRGRFTSG